ncbi:MAG: protein-disulfide reductase DsbD [Candidatus Marinarcus sp.]|uniref:protein-disulfide reductase DsbD n=1 Tax=Candidatus Marinarcus sp. TaxID=3100987 RepID=UPI003B00988F
MKKIFFLLSSFVYAFAIQHSFLEPSEAFKTSMTKSEKGIVFQIDLGKEIYVYHDKVKVLLTQPLKSDITNEASISQPVEHDSFMVNFDQVKIEVPFAIIEDTISQESFEIEFKFQGCSTQGLCYAPMSEKHRVTLPKTQTAVTSQSETDLITNSLKDESFVWVLLTFFGFGLLLSLTPCVFPMIPILSAIIVKAGNSGVMSAKKGFLLSLVYVLAMSLAYTIAGVLAGIFGANLQVALQNPYVLVAFAAIFIALALSMFGYYRLEPPKWLQSKVYKTTDHQNKQGILGIAIMGFLSALIVGPCVAPPLAGALVYIGQTGDAFLGGIALFVLSLGMGVPLLLIGAGAGKMMPKPGGWMDFISKVFGMIMLAIAIKTLERVIPEDVIYLWAILFLGAGVYFIKFHALVLQVVAILFLTYGVTSFVGAISGAKNILNPLEKLTLTAQSQIDSKPEMLQWKTVKTVEELNQAIKESSKPVMLDFYAQWCVACKELEHITFKDEKVIKKLQGFTLLKADVTQNSDEDKALQKKYGIFGPPGLIFWNEKKQEVEAAKIIGYKNAKEFLEIVNQYF